MQELVDIHERKNGELEAHVGLLQAELKNKSARHREELSIVQSQYDKMDSENVRKLRELQSHYERQLQSLRDALERQKGAEQHMSETKHEYEVLVESIREESRMREQLADTRLEKERQRVVELEMQVQVLKDECGRRGRAEKRAVRGESLIQQDFMQRSERLLKENELLRSENELLDREHERILEVNARLEAQIARHGGHTPPPSALSVLASDQGPESGWRHSTKKMKLTKLGGQLKTKTKAKAKVTAGVKKKKSSSKTKYKAASSRVRNFL